MPKVIEKNNHIKLVLTGGPNVYEDKSFVVNLGVVPKSTLINLYKTCICLPVPIFEAYGSRIKIIEALIIGSVVLSTSKGIEGLDYNKKSHAPIVTNIISEFSKIIIQISKSKKFKKDALKDRKHYLNNYGMENQVKIFYLKLLNKIS